MITVVNKYKEPNHLYCGRGSALGNPFPMKNENERDKVCEQYEEWFYKHVDETNFLDIYYGNDNGIPYSSQTAQSLQIFEQALNGDVNLGCFCAPKRCHCETIKHFIDCKIEESFK
jgi:hypothetical protein